MVLDPTVTHGEEGATDGTARGANPLAACDAVAANGYEGFILTRSANPP